MSGKQPLFRFPCDYPIKAMGRSDGDFDAVVVEINRKQYPDIIEGAVKSRLSKAGKYMSVTMTIQAQSRVQRDGIYRDLVANEKVLMAL
jgi:hypothetical protein